MIFVISVSLFYCGEIIQNFVRLATFLEQTNIFSGQNSKNRTCSISDLFWEAYWYHLFSKVSPTVSSTLQRWFILDPKSSKSIRNLFSSLFRAICNQGHRTHIIYSTSDLSFLLQVLLHFRDTKLPCTRSFYHLVKLSINFIVFYAKFITWQSGKL